MQLRPPIRRGQNRLSKPVRDYRRPPERHSSRPRLPTFSLKLLTRAMEKSLEKWVFKGEIRDAIDVHGQA